MPFAPTDISGLKLWLKADAGVYHDAGTTLCTNGQTVQQWNDQSGNGNHATQGTSANRPTYLTNSLNSLPYISFDWTAPNWMSLPDLSGNSAVSVFGVIKKFTAAPTSIAATGLWWLSSSTQNTHYPWYFDGLIYDSTGNLPRPSFAGGLADTTTPHLYEVISSASDWTAYQNGSLVYDYGSGIFGTLPSAPYLGASNGAATYFLDGALAEVIIYNSALGSTDRVSVENYLGYKWGLGFGSPPSSDSLALLDRGMSGGFREQILAGGMLP